VARGEGSQFSDVGSIPIARKAHIGSQWPLLLKILHHPNVAV
jgi:hypothetical protein